MVAPDIEMMEDFIRQGGRGVAAMERCEACGVRGSDGRGVTLEV